MQAQEAFENGKRAAFFALWSARVVPRSSEAPDIELEEKRLMFYSNVYFAIYPLFSDHMQKGAEDLGSRMEQFKRFLDTDGATLAATAEFIPFYALPYDQNLMHHTKFMSESAIHADTSRSRKATRPSLICSSMTGGRSSRATWSRSSNVSSLSRMTRF